LLAALLADLLAACATIVSPSSFLHSGCQMLLAFRLLLKAGRSCKLLRR